MDAARKKIVDHLAKLEEAKQDIRREMLGLAAMTKGLPCNAYELLQVLDELADAEADVDGHHGARFPPKEYSLPHSLQSQECKDDWTRCYNRRNKAILAITRFATALRHGEAEAA